MNTVRERTGTWSQSCLRTEQLRLSRFTARIRGAKVTGNQLESLFAIYFLTSFPKKNPEHKLLRAENYIQTFLNENGKKKKR